MSPVSLYSAPFLAKAYAEEGENMMPETVELPRHGPPVTAVVDDSDDCLADIVAAAKEAQRRQRPLELIQAPPQLPISRLQQSQRMQRIDTAVHEARQSAPGVEVRLRLPKIPVRGVSDG